VRCSAEHEPFNDRLFLCRADLRRYPGSPSAYLPAGTSEIFIASDHSGVYGHRYTTCRR